MLFEPCYFKPLFNRLLIQQWTPKQYNHSDKIKLVFFYLKIQEAKRYHIQETILLRTLLINQELTFIEIIELRFEAKPGY